MSESQEITKVRIIIRKFLWETRDVVNDPKKSQEWLTTFRNTLQYQDLEERPNQYAMLLLAESKSFSNLQLRKIQMRWVRSALEKEGVKNPTQDQLDERWLAIYGIKDADACNREAQDESATICDTIEDKAVEELPPLSPKEMNLPSTADSPKKFPHGEFNNVMLTAEEREKLYIKIGNDADTLIEELSGHMASKGVRYKNHYATILNWWRRRQQEKSSSRGYKTAAEKDVDAIKNLAAHYANKEVV